jgi:hypothetical protein
MNPDKKIEPRVLPIDLAVIICGIIFGLEVG